MVLLEKYCECPKCGSASLSNGLGSLVLEDDYLLRYCGCGFSIVVDEDDNELETQQCSVCDKLTINKEIKHCIVCEKPYCYYCENLIYNGESVCSNCDID